MGRGTIACVVALSERCASLTPVVGTTGEILRFAQDDIRK
jgi:hypothetical protein